MTQSRAIVAGVLVGFLSCVGLLAVVFLGLSQASAAPPAQTNPPGAANSTTQNGTASSADPANPKADAQHYADLLVQNFAGQLGVDQAKVNSAFTAAVNATVDQAVQDGKLTADQADKVKTVGNQSLGAFLGENLSGLGPDSKMGGEKGDAGPWGAIPDAVIAGVAPLFGMTVDQLQVAFKNGQTLATLEQAHNVTAQQVHDTALAAGRTVINAGVQSGKWSQAEADTANQSLNENIDNLLLKLSGGGGGPYEGADPQIKAIEQAIEAAIAPLFGLDTQQLRDALKNGQTLT